MVKVPVILFHFVSVLIRVNLWLLLYQNEMEPQMHTGFLILVKRGGGREGTGNRGYGCFLFLNNNDPVIY